MLIEGDSWFAFPMVLRTNITAELKRINQDKIVQLPAAKVGNEIRAMLCGDQYAYLFEVMAEDNLSFDCLLLSGGGNDIVDVNLPALLNQYESGMMWEDCLNMRRFNRRLQEIESAYLDVADLREDYQPAAWIFTHAYDYAIPSGQGVRILGIEAAGGWIQEQMDAKAIPAGFQRQIIDYMLARFDDRLIQLEQAHEKWCHIRTQGTLKDSDWGDELHPTTAGFQKITAKFQTALVNVFPQLPPPQ